MKIALVTDLHFGARNDSKRVHDYFQKFYDEIFFPTIKERGIDTVIGNKLMVDCSMECDSEC